VNYEVRQAISQRVLRVCNTVQDAVNFMAMYDPDGTVPLAIYDQSGNEVCNLEFIAVAEIWSDVVPPYRHRVWNPSSKVDWKEGF